MIITLKYLADQVFRRMSGFAPGADLEITHDDMYPYIVQQVNKLLKTEYLQVKMRLGDDHVQETAIATFSDIKVIPYDDELILSCESFAFNTELKEWAEADGDVWIEADGDIWVVSGSTNVRIQSSENGEELYDVVIDQLSFPAGKSSSDFYTFVDEASEGYIELILNTENVVAPTRFYTGGISNLQDTGDGVSFTYDLLEIQNAAPEIQRAVRPSAILMRGSTIDESGITMTKAKRCGANYGSGTATIAAALLPTQPISLPYGQGVWRVFDPTDPLNEYIPVGNAYYGVVSGVDHTGLASFLGSQVTYTWFSNDRIVFNQPTSLMPERIAMQLAVVSLDQVGIHDPLPIPADYEADVVEAVFAAVVRAKLPDYQVDSTEEPQS